MYSGGSGRVTKLRLLITKESSIVEIVILFNVVSAGDGGSGGES